MSGWPSFQLTTPPLTFHYRRDFPQRFPDTMTSRVAVLEVDATSHGDQDSDARSDRGRPSGRRHDRERRERRSDHSDHRDNTHVLAKIKLMTVTHLLVTKPLRQYSKWHTSLKSHLINADPLFGDLLDGEDSEWLYHYELALARLITIVVKDEDAIYLVAGTTRRHKAKPGTAALAALADAYQYDPLDHVQRLKAELHRPIQPGNTLRGYLNDLNRIRTELEDLGQRVLDKELIVCLMNGLRVLEYMSERNFLVHNPLTSFEMACSLCKKIAIQDTIVAGVVGSLPTAAFYAGPPAPPSSLA